MPIVAAEGALSSQGYGQFARQSAAVYIEDVFSTWLYTGNGSTQTITNGIDLAGKGGLVWIKDRNNTGDPKNHYLYDTARGTSVSLSSNTSNGNMATSGIQLTAFNSNGFNLGSSSNVNQNTFAHVSWTFRKQPKFFDVVTFTRASSASPSWVSHSLGAMPGCVIIKALGAVEDWFVVHRATNGIGYLNTNASFALNSAPGLAPPGTFAWMNATSTQIDVASFAQVGVPYVAYLFAHNAGGFGLTGTDNVITCGSFVGNATVNLGYEPQWLLTKSSTTASTWDIYDTMRGFSQMQSAMLNPNNANAEAEYANSVSRVTPTATGFSASGWFTSGQTYIYIAIRRGPMKTPTSGTSVFNSTLSNATTGTPISINGVPDAQLLTLTAGGLSPRFASRLTGVNTTPSPVGFPFLGTALSDSEITATNTNNYWRNNAFNFPSGFSGSSTIFWTFSRAPGFFDVVCYTGVGGGPQTITHNLGVAPELVFVKSRTQSVDGFVYSATLGLNNAVFLFSTSYGADASTSLGGVWGTSNPTSTTFTVGNYSNLNNAGDTYVAYLFASCPGVSKVGSYTGTGSTLQINCGFTGGARFVLIKRTNASGGWYLWDSARGIVAGNDPYLLLNSTAAQVTTTDWVDTHSPGFELSNAGGNLVNVNGGAYIFLAIA